MIADRVLRAMLRPAQVGRLLGVNPKTVTRLCDDGRLKAVRIPGGHRRILASVVWTALINGGMDPADADAAVAAVVQGDGS